MSKKMNELSNIDLNGTTKEALKENRGILVLSCASLESPHYSMFAVVRAHNMWETLKKYDTKISKADYGYDYERMAREIGDSFCFEDVYTGLSISGNVQLHEVYIATEFSGRDLNELKKEIQEKYTLVHIKQEKGKTGRYPTDEYTREWKHNLEHDRDKIQRLKPEDLKATQIPRLF